MDPRANAQSNETSGSQTGGGSRSESFSSQKSDDSHTAAEFIEKQLELEEEAREALPYSIDTCTKASWTSSANSWNYSINETLLVIAERHVFQQNRLVACALTQRQAQNRFCGCGCDYDAYKEKGTMFQCLGLGSADQGGCGEDWWHPGCIAGLGPNWYENMSNEDTPKKSKQRSGGPSESITEAVEPCVAEPSNDGTGETKVKLMPRNQIQLPKKRR
ncbi:hypothetical protein DID88_010120 [Monilinia fructigena]|uniref:Uncharacterized protein n=1 Tax=Monilinia fructigena TaxID=38457 RepID=A0A395IMC0_9HELO|nr:hypothetical protein DID88_010120 [Monilinia fructigena]